MFGPAGIAYVYLVYGMYDCLNVVTGLDGAAAAVLIRAVEPLTGIEAMRLDRARVLASRRRAPAPRPVRPDRLSDARVASGPGLIGAAFGLDRSWTGVDLCDPDSPLRLETAPEPGGPDAVHAVDVVVATPRIGIAYAGEPWASVPWRLAIAGHPSVSGTRPPR